jgi:hydrogenase maturation protease
MRHAVAVVGIGNTLAGDDGLGIEVIRRLGPAWDGHPQVLLAALEGDLMAVADLAPDAGHFLFVDAVAGDDPGQIRVSTESCRAFAPSLHQADITTIMSTLAAIELVDPFPEWEVWGIVISPPRQLGEGLSPLIEAAVEALIPRLEQRILELLPDQAPST